MIGRYFLRCSSEPKWSSGMMNIELRPAIEAQAGENLAISSRAMQTIVKFPFGPPYSSGTPSCIRPISPNNLTISRGKRSVSSISAAIGATCLATILLMLSRKANCSSVKLMKRPQSFVMKQKSTSIEWVIHLIITHMMTKSSPRKAAPPRLPALNRRDRTADPRATASPSPVKFRPIYTRRAFEEICERIREQLALGVLKPGDKLPPERDLAQQLGVSRNVLREALRSLEMAGVLRLLKGVKGGAFIQEGDTSRMNEVMRDMLSLGTISVRELSEARIHVLDLAVRLACVNARQADFEALEANIERTDLATRDGRLLDRVECSREFYKLLALATGNKVIAMIMDSVTEIHMRFVYAKVVSSGVAMAGLSERRRKFLTALRERNVTAASHLMRLHLESVQRMLESDPGSMSLHVALAEVQQPGLHR